MLVGESHQGKCCGVRGEGGGDIEGSVAGWGVTPREVLQGMGGGALREVWLVGESHRGKCGWLGSHSEGSVAGDGWGALREVWLVGESHRGKRS